MCEDTEKMEEQTPGQSAFPGVHCIKLPILSNLFYLEKEMILREGKNYFVFDIFLSRWLDRFKSALLNDFN